MSIPLKTICKYRFIFCLILITMIMLQSCQAEDETWNRIEKTAVLKVGLDPTYPPFEVADESGLYGLDIDLANAVAADLGLNVEFVLFGYDGLYDALATQQVDVLLSALIIAPERTRDFAYTEPYFNAGEILIVRADNEDIGEMADLNGRFLAVELGAQGHVEATSWERKLSNLTVQPFGSADEALTAVANGSADAALIDAISGRLFVAEHPMLSWVETAVSVEPFAMVVRIADEQLLEKLNESLARLQENGTHAKIINKWIDQ